MTARQKIHQATLARWATIITDQKASGLTIRQWCNQYDLSFHAFNYWKHQLKKEAADRILPDIVPLAYPASGECTVRLDPGCANRAIRTNRANTGRTVCLNVNGIYLELESSIPEDFLFMLIRAVRHA